MGVSFDTPLSHQEHRALLRALQDVLPRAAVLHDPEELCAYGGDGLTAYRRLPAICVLPHDVDQVRAVLRVCRQHAVPVVARGAGTGLSGGALPHPRGVLLGLARLDRILQIDPEGRTARVQPGVRNLAISEAAAPFGLYYAPDPSSQIACTIGGNVAENSGGVHCLKYGLTVHNLLGLKACTIDGELLELGGAALDGPGFDLLALLTGSEGLLAVVVEATVKLLRKPEAAHMIVAAFDSVAAAGAAVAAVIAGGVIPAGLELMDQMATRATEDFVHAGYPTDAAALLLCELDGMAEQVQADTERAAAILQGAGASQMRIATDADQRRRLWAGRKAAFPAAGRLAPDYYCMDGTIPRRKLPEVLESIHALGRAYGLAVANVFHAGDGNLHPLILYDANRPGELERAEAFGGRILELCLAAGGTITGEHGVGVEKLDQACLQFGTAELEQFHALKAAFDPDGLLNPGKAIPTLHRCAELGRMHVHGGRLPHPELERF